MIQLDSYATLVAATLVLLLGRLLVNRIGPLRTFANPCLRHCRKASSRSTSSSAS